MATTNVKAEWGVRTGEAVGKTFTGVCTDFQLTEETITAQQQNEIGEVVQDTLYDSKKTMTATVQIPTGTPSVQIGSALKVGSVFDGHITSLSLIENNTSYRKYQVEAVNWPHAKTAEDVRSK